MILSPVLSIPSCPAGPFSEILEIKIPCKKRNKLWILPQRQKKSPSILHQNRNSTTEKTQTAEANVFKHDLLSYLVISHIRSRTFSTGDINSKAFVVPVDRVFNLQKKNNTQDIAKYNPSNWKISVFQVIAKFVPDCFSYLKNGSFNQCTFGCSMDRKAADLRNEQRILEFSHYFLSQTSCSFAALFKGCAQNRQLHRPSNMK